MGGFEANLSEEIRHTFPIPHKPFQKMYKRDCYYNILFELHGKRNKII